MACAYVIRRRCCDCPREDHMDIGIAGSDWICEGCLGLWSMGIDEAADEGHRFREGAACGKPDVPPLVPVWTHRQWTGHDFVTAPITSNAPTG